MNSATRHYQPSVSILGTRGIPAAHGGFETFAERLALYLVAKNWKVTVYCQGNDLRRGIQETYWKGVRLINIPEPNQSAFGTIRFDWRSIQHAKKESGPKLMLGYNTAIFSMLLRWNRLSVLTNMDGLEWKRKKWNFFERTWLLVNERIACHLSSALIADHPFIESHLENIATGRNISMIPYGADKVTHADKSVLSNFGLRERRYALVVARPEPENSILEIVRAFSATSRSYTLVLIGNIGQNLRYHRDIRRAASNQVLFMGAMYDRQVLNSLRFWTRCYVHGHRVGGTNPSLVEAIGAGTPVVAHNNVFNRWVAGSQALFFRDEDECAACFEKVDEWDDRLIDVLREDSYKRHYEKFAWSSILGCYETLLRSYQD